MSPHEVAARLSAQGYLADDALATVIAVALALRKPILLEGAPGVGKTECGKALAQALDARLIRLQCYEGVDIAHALYDWNYARQMLYLRTVEGADAATPAALKDVYGPEFLLRRPLLDAIDNDDPRPPVLLIDEIDRADDEFEAFLLELLSEFQVTVPELGPVRAAQPPVVVLTSNRTRELHEALRRRCVYHWIDFPSIERELEIVRARLGDVPDALASDAVAFVALLRERQLVKPPGIAETLDWVQALATFAENPLEDTIQATLGVLLKHEEDLVRARELDLGRLKAQAHVAAAALRGEGE